MIEGSLNHRSSVIAKASYRAANRMIHLQCQRGRPFPSRLTLKMLQFAADQGHVPAMSRLGALLYQWGVGRAVKRSGLEYIRMAAKGGDVEAQYQLGKAYFEGALTYQNNKAASHWLALAADRGHPRAADVLYESQRGQAPLEPASITSFT